jgi:outer membrane receptor protein involved in Fe transport
MEVPTMKATRSVALGAALMLFSAGWAFAGQTPPPAAPKKPEAQTPPPPAQVPVVKETVVVSASRTEQQLVNAPATMTVIDPAAIVVTSSTNYADILRSVPGLNITQISARDVNVTSRASTSSLATSELTLLDGRSLYQDFFGFTMWDFMPVNTNDIKRIEVVRGPASAVWGANAMNGVINVITKTPRENPGTTVTAGVGNFPREVFGHAAKAGWLYYVNGSHAQAINDRWAYRVSAGGLRQDPFPRPTGVIPGSPTFQAYPPYANEGTKQPKVDARFDYDFPDKTTTMSFAGGFSGTSGIMHSGIGPFSIDPGTTMSYGKFNFAKSALHVQAFLNVLDGDATNLLTVGPTGSPIPFKFTTKTFDIEAGDSLVTGTKNVVTYGGNLRINRFALTIAPGEDHRTEGGGYVQDEYVANKYVRLVAGARVDKFSSIDNAVFSPRVAFIMRPHADHTFRISYNRAFRAPSMVNNNLNVTIANPLPLSSFGQPGVFLVPTGAVGNPALKEEHTDAYEVSYTGIVSKRTTVSVAGYYSQLNNEILFTETAEWPTTTPPPGWALPAPFWAAAQASAHFPQTFTYLNLGRERNQGVELGVDSDLASGASVYANYSYQALPRVNFSLLETNHPSHHRFNAGVRYDDKRWIGSLSVSSATSAFWQDVLDVRFSGTTAAFAMANASAGVKFGPDSNCQAIFRVTNLFNQEVQQHIFGDVIKRQMVGEVRIQIK